MTPLNVIINGCEKIKKHIADEEKKNNSTTILDE